MADTIDRRRLYVPAAAGLYEFLAPLSPTLIRIAMGLIIIPHGFNKLFLADAVPTSRNFVNFGWAYPLAWAYFIGCVEFFGGICLVLGLWTRAAAFALAIQMAVIVFAVLWPNWFWGHRGMEYAMLMMIVCISILWRGGGPYALDNLMKNEF